MRILGIDPGLGITGYGLIETKGENFRLIEAGAIRSRRSESIDNRLSQIYQKLIRLIREAKPQVLVLEELYSHYKHPRTSILIGHARGVICLASRLCGIPLVSYPSTRVKKSIVGSGHASKEQIQRTVVSLLGLKRIPELVDVTDALALAMCHAYTSRKELMFNRRGADRIQMSLRGALDIENVKGGEAISYIEIASPPLRSGSQ